MEYSDTPFFLFIVYEYNNPRKKNHKEYKRSF